MRYLRFFILAYLPHHDLLVVAQAEEVISQAQHLEDTAFMPAIGSHPEHAIVQSSAPVPEATAAVTTGTPQVRAESASVDCGASGGEITLTCALQRAESL